jgi:bidirectional [NiFe] hydrogenase diaphorase subunit
MAARVVTLQIDGRDVTAHDNQLVIDVARENGIRIPKLCYVSGLSSYGGCRLCLVEVEGVSKLLAACTTTAAEGMQVRTVTPRLTEYRRMILEMLFAERNHVCSVCVSNGHCEMQWLAEHLRIDHIRFPYVYPKLSVDASHDRFVLDQNRCILCTRCVRICQEIEGAHTWDVMGRGSQSLVITDLAQPWGDAESCTSCGKCVQVCPTGALSEKGHSVSEMAKKREFLPYLTMMRGESHE